MDPVAATTTGRVRGTVEDGAVAFLGLPFARPPFGARRFGLPVPVPRWDGIRDATAYGPTAPQPDRAFTIIPEPVIAGDDCLNLNVFTPELGRVGLPVLVWIHGGGFTAGGNSSPWYRGHRFARDGVVVVSVNYRLGAEGFLAVPGAPTNRAVRDWIAALDWVQDNISAFGGDPGRVTIAGQSAGGVACATLLTAPAARGLFHGAVCLSGAIPPPLSAGGAAALTVAVAAQVGVEPTLEALCRVDPAQLVEAQEPAEQALARANPPQDVRFFPTVDEDLVPGDPFDVIARGRGADVPLLLGATGQEADDLAGREASHFDDSKVARRLARLGLDSPRIDAWRQLHVDAEPWQLLGRALTASMFQARALRLGDAWARAHQPAWMYAFEWRAPDFGAVHCLDVPFAFDVLDAPGVAEVAGPKAPQSLADDLHRAVVQFVADGDPGWARYEPEHRRTMVWDERSSVVEDPWRAMREIWNPEVPAAPERDRDPTGD
jgi:para-nitrobenzyl esterase